MLIWAPEWNYVQIRAKLAITWIFLIIITISNYLDMRRTVAAYVAFSFFLLKITFDSVRPRALTLFSGPDIVPFGLFPSFLVRFTPVWITYFVFIFSQFIFWSCHEVLLRFWISFKINSKNYFPVACLSVLALLQLSIIFG